MDVEDVIQCIKEGDEEGVRVQLQHFNQEYAQCFFYDKEERERKRRQELEEFRKNKIRDYIPDSDSDYDEKAENPDVVLRLNLTAVLTQYIRSDPPTRVLMVCLKSLRILSRDKKILGPLVTDNTLLTLARLSGLGSGVPCHRDDDDDDPENPYASILEAVREVRRSQDSRQQNMDEDEDAAADDEEDDGFEPHSSAEEGSVDADTEEYGADGGRSVRVNSNTTHACVGGAPRGSIYKMLARGKRDNRMSIAPVGTGDEEEASEDVQRKEALKVLCNVIYNSVWAQERASELRLLSGVTEALGQEAKTASPHCGQFYELRLMFLLTALRPELRSQLKQEGGLSMLTDVLEQCLEVRWGEQNQVILDPTAPPISTEATQRAMEVLKILFNITYTAHTQEPSEEDSALYRHLAYILGHCLLIVCEGEKETDELRGHTVNLLSALPLGCLDVLVSVPPSATSVQWENMNMDMVHSLLLYMERKLEDGHKVKEKLTPVLNFLTEISRAHRQTRHYLRQQILPPLRDLTNRPEHGTTLRSRLVRLMTHVDTELKHCAADLLFVLCKENVRRFVKYTGYGNAAGLLAARGLLGGHSKGSSVTVQYSSDSDSDTEEYRQAKDRVNLVTGRVEEEQPDPMEGMTEEEKEEEARRLVSLFSKLSRENVIQPMGLNADGRLTPMSALMKDPMAEESDQENGDLDDLEGVE